MSLSRLDHPSSLTLRGSCSWAAFVTGPSIGSSLPFGVGDFRALEDRAHRAHRHLTTAVLGDNHLKEPLGVAPLLSDQHKAESPQNRFDFASRHVACAPAHPTTTSRTTALGGTSEASGSR